jgi:peptide/nickel transport system substrate-binding protein
VPDAGSKLAALQTGQGDFADGLPRDFYTTLLDLPGISTFIIKPGSRAEAATNKLYAPLNNPKSRLALVKISDPEEYMRVGYGPQELWEAESCLFYCNSTWESYIGEEVYRTVDVAGAQVLWDEAVAESGFNTATDKMVLLTNPDYAEFYAAALITKKNLETLGAEVDFVVTDWATVVGRKIANLHKDPQTEEGWHFYHTASGPFDPLGIQSMSATWNGGWNNPEAQQLIIDFSQAASFQEGKDIVDELHRIWYYEDPATIMLGTASSMNAMQDIVKGYVPHRTLMFDGVWLDR